MSSLNQSMRPIASFVFSSKSNKTERICLFPGHYDTSEVVSDSETNSLYAISHANPRSIVAAGYQCSQVADDYNTDFIVRDSPYKVQITPKGSRTRYRDFLNYIKLSGLRVVKMRITDLVTGSNPSHDIFYQEIEVSKSAIGSKSGSDFIQLASHIDPSNYLQNFIEVDLEKQNLLLDETTLAFLDVPAQSNFQIDFTLAE